MISKWLGIAACVVALIGLVMLWLDNREQAAVQRGVDEQIARNIAKSNQEIATRRATDATFDKMDARQHCLDAKLDWVFIDGKSYCR